jgi:hypothetical protein
LREIHGKKDDGDKVKIEITDKIAELSNKLSSKYTEEINEVLNRRTENPGEKEIQLEELERINGTFSGGETTPEQNNA